jgi:hypothetical protein
MKKFILLGLLVIAVICGVNAQDKTNCLDCGGSSSGPSFTKTLTAAEVNTGTPVAIVSSLTRPGQLTIKISLGAGTKYTIASGAAWDTVSYIKAMVNDTLRNIVNGISNHWFTGGGKDVITLNYSYSIDPGSPIYFDPSDRLQVGTKQPTFVISTFGVGSAIQAGLNQAETDARVTAGTANMKAGVFNILDYMSGPVSNASVPLQAAIDAAAVASFLGGGGTVIIPNGAYTFTTRITMKPAVTILAARNAYCDWDGNANAMFFSNTLLTQFSIYGGVFRSLTKRNTNWVQVESTSDANYAVNNHFEPLQVTGFKHMFETISTGGGFFNENFIGNCVSWGNRAFWRDKPGAGAAGTDGNHIYNVGIQYTSDTKFGIDSLSGQKNIFNNLQFWDFPKTGVPNLSTVLLTSTSNNNYVEGSNVTDVGYQDYGYMNSGLNSGFPIGNTTYLTSTVAKTIYEGYIADGETVGGTIEYTVSATNSDNSQSQGMSGTVSFIVMRNGTTYTKTILAATPAYGESASMTDMTLTWYVYAGEGVFAIQPTCTAYVTGTLTVKMKYHVKPTDVVIY